MIKYLGYYAAFLWSLSILGFTLASTVVPDAINMALGVGLGAAATTVFYALLRV
ncbi:membrane protein [Mycobacterium phage Estes]|uniref:Membrane protein n=1 Tax=Mycobacterium phage Estes TaxID=2759459 RepID=A0A7G9A275_9CAUD|nr:membrane protein [Mycobacterium phage Estes]QNL30714.1 membrane protein [Mycobacterium phage Estes]